MCLNIRLWDGVGCIFMTNKRCGWFKKAVLKNLGIFRSGEAWHISRQKLYRRKFLAQERKGNIGHREVTEGIWKWRKIFLGLLNFSFSLVTEWNEMNHFLLHLNVRIDTFMLLLRCCHASGILHAIIRKAIDQRELWWAVEAVFHWNHRVNWKENSAIQWEQIQVNSVGQSPPSAFVAEM